MKRAFDQFYLEVKEEGVVALYMFGSERSTDYRACLQPKNFIERITSSGEAKELPNIVLRKKLSGHKIIFTKAEAGCFHFHLSSWALLPLFAGGRNMYYVSKPTALATIKDLGGWLNA